MKRQLGKQDYKLSEWGRFFDPAWIDFKLNNVLAHEAMLVDRQTYEPFAGTWPARDGELADKTNAMPKYVATTTLKSAGWNNSTIIQGDVAAVAVKLKRTSADAPDAKALKLVSSEQRGPDVMFLLYRKA
jgi:dihydrofolate reductase